MNIKFNYLKRIFDEINMMVAIISCDNTLILANKTLLDFAKVKLDDLEGIAYWDLPWWKHSMDLQNKLIFAINDSYMGKPSRFNATHTDADGNLCEVDFIIKPIMKDDEPEYFIAMGYNITELVSVQKELTQRDRRLKAFFDYSIEGYFFLSLPDQIKKEEVTNDIVKVIIDQYRIEGTNKRLLNIIGQKEVSAKSIFDNLGIRKNLESIIYNVIHEGSVTLETEIMVNEKKRNLDLVFAAIYDENGAFEGNFGIVRDVTAEATYLEKIEYLANKDYLTGINNRRSLFEHGKKLYDNHKLKNEPLTIIMLDIDHFKKVNDNYGHDAGDVVIKEIAKLIERRLCSQCVLGRYGGEEYVVIMPRAIDAASKKFDIIRKAIENKIFESENLRINVTISLGIAEVDFKTDTLESCITKSDSALYESKRNGRNRITIYS